MDELVKLHNRFTALMEKRARKAFLDAVNRTIKKSDFAVAIDDIRSGKVTYLQGQVVERFRMVELPLQPLAIVIRDAYIGGGRITAKAYGNAIAKAGSPKLNFDFTPGTPDAVEWATDNAGLLVQNINVATREAIRQRVMKAMMEGQAPWELAESLVQVVGLTPRDAQAVETYRSSMLGQQFSRSQVNTMVRQYAKQLLSARATTIARTEVLKASNAGQQEYWRQGINEGVIDQDQMVREWIATIPSERTCATCGRLDGTHAPINGQFVIGGVGYDLPPAHPNCRCTTGLVFVDPASAMVAKMNTNHDRQGRFASGSGSPVATVHHEIDTVPGGMKAHVYALDSNGNKVGYLDAQVVTDKRWDDGKVKIDYVEIPEQHRRKGVATKLVEETKTLFPGREVDPGYLTDLGAKWWPTIKKGTPMLSEALRETISKYNANHDRLGRFASGSGQGASPHTNAKSAAHEVVAGAGIKTIGGRNDIWEYNSAAEARRASAGWSDYTPFSVMSGDGTVRHFSARVTPAGKKVLAAKETTGNSATGNAQQKGTPRRGAAKPAPKGSKPTEPDAVIPHDEALPVRQGFRRVTSTHERAALMDTHGVRIPPAWTDIQVSVTPKGVKQARGGSLIATGKDAKGRTQYLYSAEHNAGRDAKKFGKVKRTQQAAKKLDVALAKDATTSPHAGAALLIRKLGMRPGSDKDTGAEKKAFGATNLEARHAKISRDGKSVTFDFDSKKGGHSTITTSDPEIVAAVKAHKAGKRPTDKLFTGTNEAKTNAYIKQHMGNEFTQKDLRTLVGTSHAASLVAAMPVPTSKAAARKARNEVGDKVAGVLQNTRTVSLKSYIAPEVFSGWPE